MGDDQPYLIDSASGAGTLVELPSHWGLDDWPQYVHSIDLDYTMPIRAPQAGLDTFRQEFESTYRHGGLWVPVLHPFAIGRMARWDAMETFIGSLLVRGDVWFAPMEEIAAHVAGLVKDGMWAPRREVVPQYAKTASPSDPPA